jgi:hypothetical protein
LHNGKARHAAQTRETVAAIYKLAGELVGREGGTIHFFTFVKWWASTAGK